MWIYCLAEFYLTHSDLRSFRKTISSSNIMKLIGERDEMLGYILRKRERFCERLQKEGSLFTAFTTRIVSLIGFFFVSGIGLEALLFVFPRHTNCILFFLARSIAKAMFPSSILRFQRRFTAPLRLLYPPPPNTPVFPECWIEKHAIRSGCSCV